MSAAVAMQGPALVAVTEHVPRAGAIVWWRLSGSVAWDRLADVFAVHGLAAELLPAGCQPPAALARAMADQAGRRKLVRSLDGAHGRAIVRETANGDALDYAVELRVKLAAWAGSALAVLHFDPPGHPLEAEVRARFTEHLGLVTADDVGGWLVKLVTRLGGVRLRDTGGVYFVPHDVLPQWEAIVAAVHAATEHRVNGVPALRTEDAVTSILDALQVEAERAAAEMEAELAAGELTARMAGTRQKRTEAMEAKVARYESLLGQRVEGLRERLESLRGGLATFALLDAEDL